MHPNLPQRLAALGVAVTLAGPILGQVPPATAAGVLPGTLSPAVLDLGVVNASRPVEAPISYTNANAIPISISAVVISPSSYRWTITANTCVGAAVLPATSCTVWVRFESWYPFDSADTTTITFGDGSALGTTGTLIAMPAGRISAERWTSPLAVRGSGTNPGSAFGTTRSSSAEYLHALFTGDTVGGVQVTDEGPYRLVSFTRSSSDGRTWSAPRRLNPTTQHGTDPTLAAAGSTVYAAWLRISHASPTAGGPRVLFMRVNRTHGAGSWEPARRLSPTTDRAIGPRLAAAGRNVYLVYTDGITGSVKVKTSRNRGVSWATRSLGTTTRGAAGWKDAGVSVAAYGDQVVVGWVSASTGTIKVRGSRDAGSTWAPTRTVGTGADPGTATSASLRGQYAAIAWADGDTVGYAGNRGHTYVTTTAWDGHLVRLASGPHAYGSVRSVAVSVRWASYVSLAIEACWQSCDPASEDYRSDVLWRESNEHALRLLATSLDTVASVARPSILHPASSLRYVMYTSTLSDSGKDRLLVRMGIGDSR